MTKITLVLGSCLAILAGTVACNTTSKPESAVVAQLASSNQDTVRGAMAALEATYPTNTTWHAAVRQVLADPREEVRLKAARVLGAVHAEVTPEDVKNITQLFRSARANVVVGALKALRGLNAPSAIPDILPLLNSPTENIVRDALRTLAVLGDASLLPKLEPLLTHKSGNVRDDARDCVTALKAK